VDARGVTGFNSPDYSLDRGLVLPDFNEPGKRSWPPHEVPLGVLLGLRHDAECEVAGGHSQ
jgi:hypothetical protein